MDEQRNLERHVQIGKLRQLDNLPRPKQLDTLYQRRCQACILERRCQACILAHYLYKIRKKLRCHSRYELFTKALQIPSIRESLTQLHGEEPVENNNRLF